ncbi:hypothetical protein Tsubulata_015924, partial [Turnera subulata]
MGFKGAILEEEAGDQLNGGGHGHSQPVAGGVAHEFRDTNNVQNKFKRLTDLLLEDEKRAPSILRDNRYLEDHMKPKVFVLGPIHHIKNENLPVEKFKQKLAARFIRDYLLEQESVYYNILVNIERFRLCYQEEVIKDYTNEELSWMLFVDGCALLFYILCYVSKDLYRLGIEILPVAHVVNDIFLLENQLPYGILDILMEGTKSGEDISSFVHAFVKIYSMVSGTVTGTEKITEHMPDHLLELLWIIMRRLDRPYNEIRRRFLRARKIRRLYSTAKQFIHWSPSRSVMELKAVRIHLRPSQSNVVTDVSFKPGIFSGFLELPRLIVDDSTAVKLSNLIAYEMSPDITSDMMVTSYVCFLNSIIANVEDVEELRSAGVIINFLPSDNDVFQLFRQMASNLAPNSAIFDDINRQIQEHLDRKGRTTVASWLADAAQVYFKTPWSTIAVLAAALAILLSTVQTYFTIFPR